jgi:hypothetical protein
MRAARPIALSLAVAIATFLIAAEPLQNVFASEAFGHPLDSFVIAQTSMGSPDPAPPPAPDRPFPAPAPAPPSPRTDYIPPTPPAPGQPSASTEVVWGAIGFTADGSYSSNWKMPSRPEAEARAAKGCAQFGRRGGCQVVSFSGQECVALAAFTGPYRRRRWSVSFTAPGTTYPEAQNAAMARCNADERSQGRCQPRTVACADGR